MKFLLDHDVPDDLSYLLEELAHEVTLLRKVLPEDASDESVLQFAHDAELCPSDLQPERLPSIGQTQTASWHHRCDSP